MDRATDPAYLSHQYGTTERLQIRLETHQRYSERSDDFFNWILDRLNPRSGSLVLDVGCGAGTYHPPLCARGVRAILGVDASIGMVDASQRQANALGLPVVTILADAQSLPVAAASYDCAMANHVLFHVPDQRAAMRELRRALRPGGRVVMATTASRDTSRLVAIHRRAVQQLGLTPGPQVVDRFNLDHLDLVRSVFPTAERYIREDAFVFPDANAVLRYYASGAVDAIVNPPPDASHRPKLLAMVGEEVHRIIRQEGVFRDPKPAGCFVASA